MTFTTRAIALSTAVAFQAALLAQTRIVPPDNSYSPAQDVELGRQAAAEAVKQLPVMHDDAATSYVQDLGARLVAAIPEEFQHPEFQYSFQVINVREINAFALPGGPMFVNRGMIEAANTEGEVAGVMGHELSHVVLRHGTAQQSRAKKYEVGQLAGAVLGAVLGGTLGTVVSQGTQFGVGTAFLRFSREFEQQADLEGARIMARAGYDPRDMANMFKTIEQQAGAGGPQWLSDHPNPGNRSEYIDREAVVLPVTNPIRDSRAFDQLKAHFKDLPPAPTTEQATKEAAARTPAVANPDGGLSSRVGAPSTRYSTYTEGKLFQISVPSNWRELQQNDSVTFAPPGGYGAANGQNVFTHGVQISVTRTDTRDLRDATNALVDSLTRGNPGLTRPTESVRISIDGREGLRTTMANRSDATGQPETVDLFTTQLRNGNLFSAVAVSPRDDYPAYRPVFDRVVASIQLAE